MHARRILLATIGLLAVAGAILGSSPSTAMADNDWHHRGHDRDWHGHRDWGPGYYAPPPVVVAPAPYGYYAPPPVYASPGVTFGLTIR